MFSVVRENKKHITSVLRNKVLSPIPWSYLASSELNKLTKKNQDCAFRIKALKHQGYDIWVFETGW